MNVTCYCLVSHIYMCDPSMLLALWNASGIIHLPLLSSIIQNHFCSCVQLSSTIVHKYIYRLVKARIWSTMMYRFELLPPPSHHSFFFNFSMMTALCTKLIIFCWCTTCVWYNTPCAMFIVQRISSGFFGDLIYWAHQLKLLLFCSAFP